MAKIAVETVLNSLKTKLPANIGGLMDTFLGSGNSATSVPGKTKKAKTASGGSPLSGIMGALGNILGKK